MINPLANTHHLRIGGFAVGAVAIAVGAVWVTASAAGYSVALFHPSSQPTQTSTSSVSQQAGAPSTACTEFIGHLSSNLGTDQTKVNAAIQKAIGQTLDDEVKNKDLTQAQADAIKKKIAGQAPCALISSGTFKPLPGSAKIGAYTQQLLSAAASSLGVTDQVLKADLAQGMTLSQIAAAQNPAVTEAQFRTRLIASLTPLLDKAVADKTLTSTQEQAIVNQLQTGTIPFWSTPMHKAKAPLPSPAATT